MKVWNRCTIYNTDSSVYDVVDASFTAASLELQTPPERVLICPMLSADSSSYGIVGAFFMTASFAFCPMTNADSSLLDILGTSFMIVRFYLCSMPNADSPLLGIVGASFMTARFLVDCSPMPLANTSIHGLFCAVSSRALFTYKISTMPLA